MTTGPDPKLVRQIAREHLADRDMRTNDVGATIMGHLGPDHHLITTFPGYHALHDAVTADVEAATVTTFWPDERPAADLAHAAEDVRKHLDLRARDVNTEVLDSPDVLAVVLADDGHAHALTESVVRTLLAERDALAAYVDRLAAPNDEAIHAAAILRDWFKSQGSLVMDEEDLGHVQKVLADYERITTAPKVPNAETECPCGCEGGPDDCRCGGACRCGTDCLVCDPGAIMRAAATP